MSKDNKEIKPVAAVTTPAPAVAVAAPAPVVIPAGAKAPAVQEKAKGYLPDWKNFVTGV